MKRKRPLTAEQAYERAALLCGRAEQAVSDIERKLSSWGVGACESAKVIKRLQSERYLDDGRFAEAFCYEKLNFSGWGRYKIMRALMEKRIGRGDVDRALATIDMTEYRRIATAVIRSRAAMMGEGLMEQDGRNKLLRFAVGRGFEMALAIDIIRNLGRAGDDD